jgi:hypothetical protein
MILFVNTLLKLELKFYTFSPQTLERPARTFPFERVSDCAGKPELEARYVAESASALHRDPKLDQL